MKRRDFIKSVLTVTALSPLANTIASTESNGDNSNYERKTQMKVLIINGSPHVNGNTALALQEMEKVFKEEKIDFETVHIGMKDIRGCIACGKCHETGKCVFDDIVNEIAPKFEQADGLVVGTPVYYASANSTLIAFMTRLFFSTKFSKTMKVGAGIAAARRGGLTSTYDEINKFFGISGMPIATGQYWNGVHGRDLGEAKEDAEGLQQMRTLARNMSFLIKAIKDAKEKYGMPKKENIVFTNFVR